MFTLREEIMSPFNSADLFDTFGTRKPSRVRKFYVKDDDESRVHVDVPGFKREDLTVKIKDGKVNVTGEKGDKFFDSYRHDKTVDVTFNIDEGYEFKEVFMISGELVFIFTPVKENEEEVEIKILDKG